MWNKISIFALSQLWITQSVMLTRQMLLKHKYTGNVTDIVFFIVCKIYFLLVLIFCGRWDPNFHLAKRSTQPNVESCDLWCLFAKSCWNITTQTIIWILFSLLCLILLRVFLVVLGNWNEFLGCFIKASSEILRKIKYLLKSVNKSMWELAAFMSLFGKNANHSENSCG